MLIHTHIYLQQLKRGYEIEKEHRGYIGGFGARKGIDVIIV